MGPWSTFSGNDLVAQGGAGAGWVALAGVCLFILLGIYAALVLAAPRLPRWLRPPTPAGLRPRITIALVLVATLPAISLALVLSDRASRQRTERVADAMQIQADGIATSLGLLLDSAAADVVALAGHAGRDSHFTPDSLEAQLRLHHGWSRSLASLVAVRRDGQVMAATSRVAGRVAPIAPAPGGPVAPALARRALAGGIVVAGTATDPVLGQRAAILVSAPVRDAGGATWGTITGALDPATAGPVRALLARPAAGDLLVTDADGRILVASAGTGLQPLDRVPQDLDGPPRGQGQAFVSLAVLAAAEGEAPAAAGRLRVLRFAPVAVLREARQEEFGVAMGWLIAALVVSVCLAIALGGSIAGPLSALDAAVRHFDPELHHEVHRAPEGAPREVAIVFEHLATAAARQRSSYEQLQRSLQQGERLRRELVSVLESREAEIQDRTQELKQANLQLDRLSRTDALSGVANRRGLAEFLDRAWRAAQREQQPVSLLMIDIDNFKSYNDAYGHPRGDTCLQAVASAITHVVGRATDAVGRYGGEEFLVVLGNTPLEGALQVAEQVRAAIEGLAIPHRGNPGAGVVTVSVGVTSSLPVRGSQVDTCLEAADRALYAAKEQGRNRVGYSTIARTGLFQSLCLPNDPDRRPS